MSSGTGREIFFGNTVRASIELITNRISPLNTGDPIVINGSIETADIRLTESETNIGVNAGESDPLTFNTFVGALAGQNITTGSNNTLLGRGSGRSITTANDNTFIGSAAGFFHETGDSNIYIGRNTGVLSNGSTNNTYVGTNSGVTNVTGSDNTYIGNSTGVSCLGSDNTFLGFRSGASSVGSTASSNVAVGKNSGFSLNTGGDFNTCLGNESGFSNQNGDSNTYLGYQSGQLNRGNNNTCVGNQSAVSTNFSTASFNVMVGDNAGAILDTGANNNTYLGYQSGAATSSGAINTFVGSRSGLNNTIGNENVMIGELTGGGVTSGSQNVVIGTDSSGLAGALSRCVHIGYQAGKGNTTDDRLIIENSSNITTPLIDGDFAGNTLTVNGTVELGTSGTTPTHSINSSTAATATAIGATPLPATTTEYLVITINGSSKRIPLFDP